MKMIRKTAEEQKKILEEYININHTGPEVEAIKGLLEDTKILDWIYAPYVWHEPEIKIIEKALGYKLFVWQKYMIYDGMLRRAGKTTAWVIRRLLFEDDIYIGFKYEPHEERFENKELLKIAELLKNTGLIKAKIHLNKRNLAYRGFKEVADDDKSPSSTF